ncbi:dihydrofolate reductase family protein [Nocardia stercoris]|uniref:Deaminase n=1 Tax=Nocardia stercoris TaxID=2483361 RepID=A0A3M2L4Y9_9NOCA|nr:dihydrofolate reductase family protein [Nocardia stercoris]RMI32752.1 deaminase [Nocardia stercoris]
MGTIVISTNVTLDGVVQDPDGQEGFAHGGWFGRFGGADLPAWAAHETEEAMAAAALLLGRRSDAWFAARWSERTDPWANRLNSMPKYVVSATLEKAAWQNSTVLSGEVVQQVSKLKAEIDGEIVVYASYRLTRALIEHGLADQLRLVTLPVVLGTGERLFQDISAARPARLIDVRTIGEGLVFYAYDLTGNADHS